MNGTGRSEKPGVGPKNLTYTERDIQIGWDADELANLRDAAEAGCSHIIDLTKVAEGTYRLLMAEMFG